ncbi:MAG: hypothetical protein QGG40_10840 [Myxococcota bacterium]|nr:hypothetical protein [Myxococcota bacterium]
MNETEGSLPAIDVHSGNGDPSTQPNAARFPSTHGGAGGGLGTGRMPTQSALASTGLPGPGSLWAGLPPFAQGLANSQPFPSHTEPPRACRVPSEQTAPGRQASLGAPLHSPAPAPSEVEAQVRNPCALDKSTLRLQNIERRMSNDADPEGTVALLERFLDECPASTLAPEAQAARLLAQSDVVPPEDAVSEIQDWLAQNPESPRRLDLLEMEADLAREEMEDCNLALPAYRALSREASGRVGAEATAWLGLCAQETGRLSEGRTALRRAMADEDLPADLFEDVAYSLTWQPAPDDGEIGGS